MEVANVRLRLNKVGSDVPLFNVTPAEVMLLHILHGSNNGGSTFGEKQEKIEITGTAKVEVSPAVWEPHVAPIGTPGNPGYVAEKPAKLLKPAVLRDRTDAEELRRLTAKYAQARNKENKPIIGIIWPDRFNPKLPQTFKEIEWTAIGDAAAGLETAAVNYATGAPATPTLPK